MGIGSTFCQLGQFLDEWETEGATIQSVTLTEETGVGEREDRTADVTFELPIGEISENGNSGVTCKPTTATDGSLTLNLETDLGVPDTIDLPVDVEPVDATFQSDGKIAVTTEITVFESTTRSISSDSRADKIESNVSDSSSPSEIDRSLPTSKDEDIPEPETGRSSRENRGASDDADSRTRDVPPFKDPDLLREIYDSHDTFAEMADALDMDVTGETVRRYMIDYDIHQPTSYRSSDDSDPESDPDAWDGNGNQPTTDADQQAIVLSDGVGLPENVTVEDLIETVNRSNTIYEVKEDLDLERKEAHRMLKELNLIDLVLGRLDDETSHSMTREDVIERLRQFSDSR